QGFFWSNDAAQWTQAEPINSPLRVNKVLRFNRLRAFAATSEGVFTTRDSGKSWYRLAGSDNRTLDVTLGVINGTRALFALTENGIAAFDGERWVGIDNAPAKGKTIAV